MYGQALEMTQRLFEGDHSSVALSLNNLASLYKAQGRLSEAEPLYGQAFAMFEKTLGINHPSTQVARENLEKLRQQMRSPTLSPNGTKPPTRANSPLSQLVRKLRQLMGSIRRFLRSLLRRLGLI